VGNCHADILVKQLHFPNGTAANVLETFSPVIKFFLSQSLGNVICQQFDFAIDGLGSKALRNASAKLRKYVESKPESPSHPVPLPQPVSDFAAVGHNPAVLATQKLLNKVLVNPASPHNLNRMTGSLLGPDGSMSLKSGGPFLPFRKTITIPRVAVVNVTIESFTVRGLDKLSTLQLNTRGSHQVGLGLAFAKLGLAGSIKLDVAPHGANLSNGGVLSENFDLSALFHNISTGASVFTAINQTHLGSLAANQLFSFGCIAPAIHTVLELQASLGVPSAKLSLTPLGGETIDRAVHYMLNSIASLVLGQFSSGLDVAGNHIMAVTVRDYVNKELQQAFSVSSSCLDPKPTYTNAFVSTTLGYSSAALCMVAVMFLVGSLMSWRSKDASNTAGILGTTSDSDPTTVSAERMQSRTDCLACHPRLPIGLRWGLPILDLAVMCLFIAGHCKIGTSVRVNVVADGQPVVNLPSVFDFSLIGSIKDMWDSRSYMLAWMVIIFSGVWPYVKLLMMLFCWFTPTGVLSASKRLSMLEFLDNWGKWSLVDVYIMVLFMVAFHFELSSDDKDHPIMRAMFSEADVSGRFVVHVEPAFAFHTFVAATLGSLTVGTLMTACHRYALCLAEYSVAAVEGNRQRLCNVLKPPGAKGKVFACGPVFAVGFSLVLVVLGVWIDIFAFNFEGLAGYVLGSDRTRTYSAITLGLTIPEASTKPENPQMLWLMGVFLLFGVLSQVAYLSILIVLWCAKLSPRLQRHFFVAAQVLSGWSALDVFVVSIVAAVLEIERLALFIVGDKCDSLNKILKSLPLVEGLADVKTCFALNTELKDGFWVLLFAVIISSVMGRVMIARCKAALCSGDSGQNLELLVEEDGYDSSLSCGSDTSLYSHTSMYGE
jgi:hypothetical protein